jgi:hypothetical protein
MASSTLKCGCSKSSCIMYLDILRNRRISRGLPLTHIEPDALVVLDEEKTKFLVIMLHLRIEF